MSRDAAATTPREAGGEPRRGAPWFGVMAVIVVLAALAAVWTMVGRHPAQDSALPWRGDLTTEDRQKVLEVTTVPTSFAAAQPFERNSGGAATYAGSVTRNAFSMPAANLSLEGQQLFALGNALFRKTWVSSPSSTQASDGLGPLYNARSCQRCHLKDGRGHPPAHDGDEATSFLLRIALPSGEEGLQPSAPDPVYGGQIQDVAVPGLPAEGKVRVRYTEREVALNGGETVSLREPHYELTDLGYGTLGEGASLSPRIAQPMIGLGLLDAIHPGDIAAGADPDDRDGDGISGRLQRVADPVTGEPTIGRFGWKAGAPTVRAQSAGAFANDMGISSALHPAPAGECTAQQPDCLKGPHGVQEALSPFEASDEVLDLVAFYSSNLAVPARRNESDAAVLTGKALFHEVGCGGCHRPNFVTRRDAAQPEHQFQLIWPYTDLLLHDLGEGLSSNSQVGQAAGAEWRTAPLWGIGLTETVSGHNQLLHDGRARGLLEAIVWHGGEAQASRDAVVAMTPDERSALLSFLRSL
ncbi:MAG: di-heme oxidoredictase family protein [Pseudomonadota bacterium]